MSIRIEFPITDQWCREKAERPSEENRKQKKHILDISQEPPLILPRQPPGHQRSDRAHRKRIQQHIIHFARPKEQSGTDDAPYDRGGVEDFGIGADEAGSGALGRLADVRDVGEEPRLDAELDCACYGGGDDL